jgi:O-antigen/teichoic acid export membrane protein
VGIEALRDRDDPGRDETPEERADRNLSELLQELRVAGIGVQVLFGFLLSLPFTNRFRVLDADQRLLYTVTIVVAAAAIACLITPVAFHRMEFRRHEKDRVVSVSHAVSIVGLAAVALALTGSVALVMTMVHDGVVVPIIVAVVAGMFAGLWFVLPLATRRARVRR